MTPRRRRLAAILAADVIGYSRLMERDEAGTLARVEAIRDDIVATATSTREGRIFKTTGDGVLAEFASAVAAVEAAVAIQATLAEHEVARAEAERIDLRIGISLGDVMVDGDDLYGNGVNVAARMESLAEPGGICVSGNVHEHVAGALDVAFEDLGPQRVKNIEQPIHCYRVATAATPAPRPRISDKPGIVVLPFANMSGDEEQAYFSDGITEDIITALSRIRQLFVMARNTAFTYKGQAVDVRAVARELGVRYVLEGSVRRAGNRVRITAQLIHGESGDHLWAERYDRNLEDIFAVQDEITEIVAGTLEPEITKAEFERQRHAPPDNLDAWQLFQRGIYHFHRVTDDDDQRAIALLEAAIVKDAGFSPAYAALARCHSRGAIRRLDRTRTDAYEKALVISRKAVSLDPEDAHAHAALGFASEFEDARHSIRSFRQALSLNPNLAHAHFGLGMILLNTGQTDASIEHIETAIRLSPRDPLMTLYQSLLGSARFALADDEGALELMPAARPGDQASGRRSAVRVAALAHLGRGAEAQLELDRYMIVFPHATVSLVLHHTSDLGGRLADGLRKAGMPE